MRKLKPAGILLVVLLASCYAGAQKVDSILNVLATQYPAEKLFIHYDKESYVAGETIWFKAYFSSDGRPSGLSSNLYMNLSDEKGKTVIEQRYPVMGATAKGSLVLPDTLPQGNYYIQAATPVMMNYGPGMINTRNFFVFNPLKKPAPAQKIPPGLSLQFFPESGQLVDGILTVVAFKATDTGGNPVEISGVIRTEEGTTICSFKSYHDGIGKTQFKPQAGKKYKAEIEENNKLSTFPLPEVKPAGINLKVQDEEGGKLFLLSRRETEKGMYANVSIIAEMNNRIVFETEVDFEDYPSVKGHLITDSLPSGILHFTVFNKDGLPLAERLSFVNNREYLGKGEIIMSKTGLTRRAENEIEISFPDSIQRSLSISVTDGTLFSPMSKENIWSGLLLTGELKGAVYNPAYYFEKNGDSVSVALDNLMLTHGWSRFEWKKLLANEFPPVKYTPANFLYIKGIVNDEQEKKPATGGYLNIYSESEDSSSQQYQVPVGGNGSFVMDSIIFYGKTKFFYAYTNSHGKQRPAKVHIETMDGAVPVGDFLAKVEFHQYVKLSPPHSSLGDQQYQWLRDEKDRVKVLERVVLESRSSKKPIEQVNEKYTTGVFRAMGKVNIDNITQPASDKSANVLDYIKNRIQQVQLVGGRFVSRKHFSLSTGQQWAVDVFVDEIPAMASLLRTLRVDEVALIKYYESGFVGVGSSSPGGAIAVYTKRDDKPDRSPDKLEYFTGNGYSITREFYSPDHSGQDLTAAIPDHRTTLYWNADLYTDSETRSVKLNFFNNDHSKKLKVVVMGFDVNGKLVHLEKWVE